MTQAGYCENLFAFSNSDVALIVEKLKLFVTDASDSQVKAWQDSIYLLQRMSEEISNQSPNVAQKSSLILEYTIPLESRRIDAVLLLPGIAVVIEFKGKWIPSQADIDQAAAYARDLRAYHKECLEIPVKCVLFLTGNKGAPSSLNGVDIIGAEDLLPYCKKHIKDSGVILNADKFLAIESYQPLPSLIKAARELFQSDNLKRIHRAAVATEPTLAKCSDIIHKTAKNKKRSLILISGVPGAGKTLVGLQLAHAKYLDDLAVIREGGAKPTAPAVFLSGNGPLVEVLQYELRSAGGDGKAFVRGVHEYVKTFTRNNGLIPPQHVLIYDEAQRAFDAAQVKAKHPDMPPEFQGLSEPELFIRFAERIPEWCVVVGLIGSGQEIHIGEEAGLGQWKDAIEQSGLSYDWAVYLPDDKEMQKHFEGFVNTSYEDVLKLSVTIRFHLATKLHLFVEHLLEGNAQKAKEVSVELEKNGYNLRLTYDLNKAKNYLINLYYGNSEARFGLIASAKDKDLNNYEIPKGFNNPGEINRGKYGPWYSEPIGNNGSCTALDKVVTEFGIQGLELDASLIAWGTDFIRDGKTWTNKYAAGYREAHRIRDAKNLRLNAYRVLLTRGRDGCVIFVPPIQNKTKETYEYFKNCGFTELQ